MSADFQQSLCTYLMIAGTTGRREAEILKRFDHLPVEQVMMELEALWAEEKVQRFTLSPNGRIKKNYVWRATTKMNV